MDADETAIRFAELYRLLYHRYSRRLAPGEHRPSPESIAMLEHLVQTGPLTIAEAGRHFGRSQSATSERVDRMERRGLLERMPDQRDRRRSLVWLTRRGREFLEQAGQVLSPPLLAQAFGDIPEAQRQRLLESLEALLEHREADP